MNQTSAKPVAGRISRLALEYLANPEVLRRDTGGGDRVGQGPGQGQGGPHRSDAGQEPDLEVREFRDRVIVSGRCTLQRSRRQLVPPAPGSGTGTGPGTGTGDHLVSGFETECPGTPAPGATRVLVEHPNSKDRHAKAATRRIETLLGRRPPGQPRGDQCRIDCSEPKPQVTGSSSG